MAVKAYNTITLIRIEDALWEIIDGYWYKNGINQGIKAQGEDGLDGLTAYESAVIGGYLGTEAEFYEEMNLIEDTRHKVDITAEIINDFNNDIHEELGAIDTSLLEYQQRMEALDGEGGSIELTTQEIENLKSTVVGVQTILGEQSARWSFIDNRIIEMANGNIWIGEGGATEDNYSTGILIGPNYDPATGLTKNRIAFYNQGVLTAYMQDGLMRIDHGIFIESATISNFKFEAISGTDILSISFVG